MLENVKIEKGVPIPKSRKRTDQKPWCDMQPGDSFFVPAVRDIIPQDGPMRHQSVPLILSKEDRAKLRKSLMHLGHKYFGPGNYSVLAAVGPDHVQGFRVWRRA